MEQVGLSRILRFVKKAGLYAAMMLIAIWCLFPLYVILLNSFKIKKEVYHPELVFVAPKLTNYITVLMEQEVWKYIVNSTIIAVFSTLLALILGGLTAYGLSRFDTRGKQGILSGVLLIRQLPPIAMVLPFFVIAFFTRMIDRHMLLIVIYLTFNLPLSIWMLKGFFDKVPISLEEAALIDGCTRRQTIVMIVAPLVLPGVLATGVLCFSYCWNEFLYALFLTSIKAKTIPTVISEYVTRAGVEWGNMSAVAVLTVMPVLVLAVSFRRHFVQGLTFGATK